MKKIGFIDYFIDEWHAEKYPSWIRSSRFAGEMDVVLAWEEKAKPGGKSIDAWCREQNVQKAGSLEEVVRECDYIIVLSPDNPERHEDLTDLPLRSGKPVYVDKTFATSRASAARMLNKANHHNTPMFTTSALRFSPDLADVAKKVQDEPIQFLASSGPGKFSNYGIHQVEPLVSLMGVGARRVMQCGTAIVPLMLLDYNNGRRATTCHCPGTSFRMNLQWGESSGRAFEYVRDFWEGEGAFIDRMLQFFTDGKSPVDPAQTLEISGILEACVSAQKTPDQWVDIPQEG